MLSKYQSRCAPGRIYVWPMTSNNVCDKQQCVRSKGLTEEVRAPAATSTSGDIMRSSEAPGGFGFLLETSGSSPGFTCMVHTANDLLYWLSSQTWSEAAVRAAQSPEAACCCSQVTCDVLYVHPFAERSTALCVCGTQWVLLACSFGPDLEVAQPDFHATQGEPLSR